MKTLCILLLFVTSIRGAEYSDGIKYEIPVAHPDH
jgi:hypothetical protein